VAGSKTGQIVALHYIGCSPLPVSWALRAVAATTATATAAATGMRAMMAPTAEPKEAEAGNFQKEVTSFPKQAVYQLLPAASSR